MTRKTFFLIVLTFFNFSYIDSILIIGCHTKTKEELPVLSEECILCKNNPTQIQSAQLWLDFFFIPVFPINTKTFYISCPRCRNIYLPIQKGIIKELLGQNRIGLKNKSKIIALAKTIIGFFLAAGSVVGGGVLSCQVMYVAIMKEDLTKKLHKYLFLGVIPPAIILIAASSFYIGYKLNKSGRDNLDDIALETQ